LIDQPGTASKVLRMNQQAKKATTVLPRRTTLSPQPKRKFNQLNLSTVIKLQIQDR